MRTHAWPLQDVERWHRAQEEWLAMYKAWELGEFWEYQHLGTAKMEKKREPSGPINIMVQTATAEGSLSIAQRLGSEITISDQGWVAEIFLRRSW